MENVQEYTTTFIPRMKINFDGGDLTSDAGLLLYKEFDHHLGLSETVREQLIVHDSVDHLDHTNHDVVMQKVYQLSVYAIKQSTGQQLRFVNGDLRIVEKLKEQVSLAALRTRYYKFLLMISKLIDNRKKYISSESIGSRIGWSIFQSRT